MIIWVLYFSTDNDRAYILLEKAGTDVKIALNNDLMAPRTGTHTHAIKTVSSMMAPFLFCLHSPKNIFINYILLFKVCIMSQKTKKIIIDIKNILN